MPYLLDADWAVYALAKRADILKILDQLAPEGVFLSWVTVGEVYEVAFGPGRKLDTTQIRADLRRRGQTIPDLDLLAAATALHYDLTVLTSDKHFQRVPGLKLYTPKQA